MFPARNAGVTLASLRQAPQKQVAVVLLLLPRVPKGKNHNGGDVLALKGRVVKPRSLQVFRSLNPLGNRGAAPPQQSTKSLPLLRAPASRGTSLRSGMRHDQALLLWETLRFSPPNPAIWPSTGSSACPTAMTAVLLPPAPSARAGAQAHSCSGFGFYGSPPAALLPCQTLPPRAGWQAVSQRGGCQRGSARRDRGAGACIVLPAASRAAKRPRRLGSLICTRNNILQYRSCVAAALGVIKPGEAETPLRQAPCHREAHASTDTPASRQSPGPHRSHAFSSPNGMLSGMCCKGQRTS